jgi:hypothetical protein
MPGAVCHMPQGTAVNPLKNVPHSADDTEVIDYAGGWDVGEYDLSHHEPRAAVREHSASRGSRLQDPQPGIAAVIPGAIVRCRNRDWVLLPGD